MSMAGAFATVRLVILVLVTFLWLISLRLRDAGIVVIFCGTG